MGDESGGQLDPVQITKSIHQGHTDKFDKFTERARKALSLAQEEARRFNHHYIGTEHLLLGLVRERDGVAARVLSNLGVELNKLRSAVEFIIGRGDGIVQGDIGMTPRAKKVIELAVDEARGLNAHYIGTEHMLLGLVREDDGIAAGVLESLGVDLEKVRTLTIQVLNQISGATDNSPKHSKTPTLDQSAIDLTRQARQGALDPVVGYESEIELVIQILSRRQRNNPTLIGTSGFSKTAIVEGLAQKIIARKVPVTLAGKRLLMLDIGSLLAGTKYRGELEERMNRIIEEIRTSQDCIIFVDEVHILVGASTAEGAVDAAIVLKPALARGELQCIGASTFDDYRKYIEKDAALQQRFQEVMVRERTIEETIDILKGIRERYEEHHRLIISDAALRDREVKLRDRVAQLELRWSREQGTEPPTVGEEDIAQVVSMWTGIPVTEIERDVPLPLSEMQSPQLQSEILSDKVSSATIFISYSHEDEDLCQVIASELASAGYNTWYDYHIPGGAAWIEEIERKIRERRLFVLLVSPEAMSSYWVQHELHLAMRLKKKIIPVRVRPTSLSESFLGSFQVLDGIQRDGQQIARLLLVALRDL